MRRTPRSTRPAAGAGLLGLVAAAIAVVGPVAEPVPTGPPEVTVREVDLTPAATTVGEGFGAGVNVPADLVGLEWKGDEQTEFVVEVRDDNGRWRRAGTVSEQPADEAPDRDSPEGAHTRTRHHTDPLWVDGAREVRVRVEEGSARDLDLHAIESPPAPIPPNSAVAAAIPGGIIGRAGWGADESLRNCSTSYADDVRFAVVHHTASGNSYGSEDSASIIRGIYAYHTQSLGWCDIAYNFLVDKYGQVFEGRAGGITRTVIGAHAGGFNTGSTGVALIGDYSAAGAPSSAVQAIYGLLAWKLWIHGVNPAGTAVHTTSGNPKIPAGTVTIPAIVGHRDVGSTECPGNNLYAALGEIRGVSAFLFALAEYYDSWHFETLDGYTTAGGRTLDSVGSSSTVVSLDGMPHVFYRDDTGGDLRHAWWTGAVWGYETLDGNTTAGGRLNADVGSDPAGIVLSNDEIHLYYRDNSAGDLRHAWWTGSTWGFETLDTAGDAGRTPTVMLYGDQQHVFHREGGFGDLVHLWYAPGVGWSRELLDGAGGGAGRLLANVGADPVALQFWTQLQIFYTDSSNGDLRHGWYTPGVGWSFETRDSVGGKEPSALLFAGQVHVFFGGGNRLRHQWYASGVGWAAEVLDGWGTGPTGQIGATIGDDSVALLYGGMPHVWYVEWGTWKLRHAWWTGAAWLFETLDGAGGPNGRVAALVGPGGSGVLYGKRPHVFYWDRAGDLRHGWWG